MYPSEVGTAELALAVVVSAPPSSDNVIAAASVVADIMGFAVRVGVRVSKCYYCVCVAVDDVF